MSPIIVSLPAWATIHKAIEVMMENRVSALPIVNHSDRCIGIFTTTDLLALTRNVGDDVRQLEMVDPVSQHWLVDRLTHSLANETVASYMSENVLAVSSETPLATAARKMLREQVHHLPVVDENEHLIGIVSTTDILAEYAESD